MTLSAAGREAIAKAQQKRWSDYKAATPTCVNGHAWTPENTRVGSSPSRSTGMSGRVCRQCERDRMKRQYWERKA